MTNRNAATMTAWYRFVFDVRHAAALLAPAHDPTAPYLAFVVRMCLILDPPQQETPCQLNHAPAARLPRVRGPADQIQLLRYRFRRMRPRTSRTLPRVRKTFAF